jgi:inner membrane transporter RhtA
MVERATPASSAGPLARAPSAGLVVSAIASVQFGSALAATLFAQLGPGDTVFLRLASAAIILSLIRRPRLRGRTPRELRLAVAFGVVLAAMNVSFYAALWLGSTALALPWR